MILHPSHDQLDRAFAASGDGDTIILGSGTYTTRGNWAAGSARGWCQVGRVRIVGIGSEHTRILLKDPVLSADGVQRPDRDLNVLWASGSLTLQGVHLDGDYASYPGWYVGGLRVRGAPYELHDVRITGLRGSWNDPATITKEIEVFAVSSQGATAGSYLDRVHVHDVAPDAYVSGIYGGGGNDGSGSTVCDCHVDLGGANQFAFASNPGWKFRDCRGQGSKYGFYNDTGAGRSELFGCHLRASYSAITLIGGVDTDVRYVVASGCRLDSPRAIELIDRSPGQNLPAAALLDGCHLRGSYVAAVDDRRGDVTVANCVLLDRGTVRFRTSKSPPTICVLNRWLDGKPAEIPETVV